jgi:hypothetical protein
MRKERLVKSLVDEFRLLERETVCRAS